MSPSSQKRHATVRIAGMTCGSCELLLERRLKEVPGVTGVSVRHREGTAVITASAGRLPDHRRIASVVRKAGYALADEETPAASPAAPDGRKWLETGAALLAVFALWKLLQTFDLVSLAPAASGAVTLGGVLLIGLVAGTSSCLAVTGGLLLAMAAKYNEAHKKGTRWNTVAPLLWFNAGRLASYFVLGGVVGLLGRSVVLDTRVTGYMNIAVALVMLYLALTILGVIPKGSCPIRPPKRLSRWVAGLTGSRHPAAPLALGAFTFFLPCGFTQSLQLVALASGGFLPGALTMFVFALGTLPSLLGISLLSSFSAGTASRLFLRVSGVAVLLLAVFNLNSGLLLTGIDLSRLLAGAARTDAATPAVSNGVQEIAMKVTRSGYEPSVLTVKAGIPVRWIVDGTEASGCTRTLVIPGLGVSQAIYSGLNVVEFTAPSPGQLAYSCGMGMVWGTLNVI